MFFAPFTKEGLGVVDREWENFCIFNPLCPPPKGDGICPLYERGLGGFVDRSGRDF